MMTMGLEGPAELSAEAERAGVPLLRTALTTPVAIGRLTALLDDRLAPRETRHGVLMDILGLGVFLTGESGIGKSECALDLVVRGHRLVADDTVDVRCRERRFSRRARSSRVIMSDPRARRRQRHGSV
jgi:HPr kinase/phosphorylase